MVSILAIVCARNEAVHIERCLIDLIASGCDVILIDNGSIDETVSRAEPFIGRGLLRIEHLPWHGRFSLSDQLRAKKSVIQSSTHDWIVHADADEWLVSPTPGQSLGDAISTAHGAGYNLVNFHECVFIPKPGEDFAHRHYSAQMKDYYFFQPKYPRLNRAWRRDAALENTNSGGHILSGAALRKSPHDLILRHYIVLSQEQGYAKYIGRSFSDEDVDRGWHGNRRIITEANLRLRPHTSMRHLGNPCRHDCFDLSEPLSNHFWEWPS